MENKNLEVIILVGIPASGKSTFCENFLKENKNWLKSSRDDFRYMLRNEGFCESKIEQMITELQKESILKALKNGYNLLIDNTNVKLHYINEFIKLVKPYANISFKIFDLPLEICLERDKARARSVGEDVITRMYNDFSNLKSIFKFEPIQKEEIEPSLKERFYLNQDKTLQKAIISDVDGTLALKHPDRNIYDESLIYMDYVNEPVANILRNYNGKIIILSGRKDSCIDETKKWLLSNNIPFDYIFMRKSSDNRKDNIVKKEIFNNEIKDKFYIEYVLDDRDCVVNAWRELGLLCLQVYYGDF